MHLKKLDYLLFFQFMLFCQILACAKTNVLLEKKKKVEKPAWVRKLKYSIFPAILNINIQLCKYIATSLAILQVNIKLCSWIFLMWVLFLLPGFSSYYQ